MTCSVAPCRLYKNPCPPRVVLDAVSTMKLNVRSSLTAGILQKRSVTFEFPRYVFNYLFNAKGDRMRNRPGKLYEKKDFNTSYFPDDSFICYNHQHEACAVVFPIYLYSYVRFTKQFFNKEGQAIPLTFTELVTMKLIKSYV